MIVQLTGILHEKSVPELVIDVNGVGYSIQAPMSTIYNLPQVGEKLSLKTHMVIREDQHSLFGFITNKERELFIELLKINGVGPKAALAILSSLSVDDFFNAIMSENLAIFKKVPGVGPKTAQRIILDMQDKVAKLLNQTAKSATAMQMQKTVLEAKSTNLATDDAISALIALGYKPQEATKAVLSIENKLDITSEALIKQALVKIAS